MTTLQTYIYKLRKDVLGPSGLANLVTQPSGYRLYIDDESVDAFDFERLLTQGRLALESGDPESAVDWLSRALALWRGQAFGGVTTGEILSAHATRLEESRLRALEMRFQADMLLGRYQEIIGELKALSYRYPLHERFQADLMTALHKSGRRSEALDVYRQLREVLIRELGLEPSAFVQRLHQTLLTEDSPPPAPDPPHPPAPVPTVGLVAALTVPAQLPPATADFTGRAGALQQVREWLAAPGDVGAAARLVLITGMPGVGKTALAVHAAHLERSRYPDGQLYADLRGSSADPAMPGQVLASFLRAVGVPEEQIPPSLEERCKLFRTWSANRRVVIVLDDACAVTQVASLLPASPHCAVIITSRIDLHSLVGVNTVELVAMTTDEGIELIERIMGNGRVVADREVAARAVALCGHLPLALRCVGTRLKTMRTWPLEKVESLLDSSSFPLEELRFADFDVRAGFDGVYSTLDPQDRGTFRLLGLLPLNGFTPARGAALLGCPPEAVDAKLTRLLRCHFVQARTRRSSGQTYYKVNRLLWLYARERFQLEYNQLEGVPDDLDDTPVPRLRA